MDETMFGEAIAINVIYKINKLKFLYHKNDFLTQALKRLLCNVLIQNRFDYACPAWHLNLTKILNSNHSKQVCAFLIAVR